MKKGQLIRRKLNNGTPVGGYMRIVRIARSNRVVAQHITCCPDDKGDEVELDKKHVYIVRVCKPVLSETVWDRINTDRQHSIIHDATAAWNKLQDNEAEVVQLRNSKYSQKVMLFTVDRIVDVWYNRQRQIRLDLGYRIL